MEFPTAWADFSKSWKILLAVIIYVIVKLDDMLVCGKKGT